MWEPPVKDEWTQPHVYALQKEIANRLIPHDGRPNSEPIVGFCMEVYEASNREVCIDPLILLGRMTLAYMNTNKLPMMTRLFELFVDVVINSIPN